MITHLENEEMQAAADRGELQAKNTSAMKKQLETTERRWIVLQVKEIAVHQGMSATQFSDMCEAIYDFMVPISGNVA